MSSQDRRHLMNTAAMAKALRFSIPTIQRLCRAGVIPARKLSDGWHITPQRLEAWIEQTAADQQRWRTSWAHTRWLAWDRKQGKRD